MIIGFDVSQTGRRKAGCGYFAAGLIGGLARMDQDNEYVLYPTFGDGVWDPAWPTNPPLGRLPNVRWGPGHRERDELVAFWRRSPPDENWLGNPRIIHSNNFFCPTGDLRARVVYTLHDLCFVEHPEWSTEENRLTCFNGVFNASVCADRIVAVSEYSRQHFLRVFPHYPSERISVIHPASRFSPASPTADSRAVRGLRKAAFWLSVATIEPRKNHRRLLRAYARLKAEDDNVFPLVLAGGKGWLMDEFEREVDALQLHKHVVNLGYVDDATLQWLYTNCFAFVYVSLFEGFGLPVLEALSCGAAVIASNTTSLPEVVGDAAVPVDPSDDAAIYTGMSKICRGEIDRGALRERGRARARLFSWDRAARQVKAVYADLNSRELSQASATQGARR